MEERGWAYRRRQPEGTVLFEAVRDHLATLLADVLACGRYGGRLRVLAYVKEAGGVRAILEHLGLPTAGARLASVREPLRPRGVEAQVAPAKRAKPLPRT